MTCDQSSELRLIVVFFDLYLVHGNLIDHNNTSFRTRVISYHKQICFFYLLRLVNQGTISILRLNHNLLKLICLLYGRVMIVKPQYANLALDDDIASYLAIFLFCILRQIFESIRQLFMYIINDNVPLLFFLIGFSEANPLLFDYVVGAPPVNRC